MSESTILTTRFVTPPYNASLGVGFEAADADRVRLRVPYSDDIANPGGALHGGVSASLIGVAGAAAAWQALGAAPQWETGTLDLSVTYLAAAIREDIVATAEVLRRGKELVYSAVDVRNDAGKRIAAGLVTYRGVDLATTPQAGARQQAVASPLPPSGELIRGANMFVSLGFIARLGIGVSMASGGEAVLTMPYAAANSDTGEAVHEGALAALIDTTGALASWSVVGLNMAFKASTVGIHVTYHAPAQREAVVAHARTLRRNNEIFLNQVTVCGSESGRIVATGSVTYRIVVTD